MLDILKGKEPTNNILVICRGPKEATDLWRKVLDIYRSIYSTSTIAASHIHKNIYLLNSPFRIRFVGREEADRAAIGYRGKIMYSHQVQHILEELGTVP